MKTNEGTMKTAITLSLITICLTASVCFAQRGARDGDLPPAAGNREDALDPTPINPAVDPNVDLFINDYKNSQPRMIYGKLAVRDILTKLEGPDPQHPTKKGAVLTSITAISYATLAPGAISSGRMQAGERIVFYATGGTGQIIVNSKTADVHKGTGFTLTPDFDFKLTNTGQAPLTFYLRTEPVPANSVRNADLVVFQRFENDRRVGAHWAHINNGGPAGLTVINIAPRTMPQPHSHPQEECWIMIEGETILSLGKQILHMTAGQAYKIPPTGITAHSNLNLGDETVEMIYLGPADRGAGGAAPGGGAAGRDYGRLENGSYNRSTEQDIDMFIGNWRDSFPRMMHGNLYMRDMLTALQGSDTLHPTRRGAVLVNSEAVSFAQLEPGASAHRIEGELKGIQQTFVVNSGSGVITSGSKEVELSKDMAFIITPGLDFKLTATGDKYMTFYVVSEKLPQGFTPKTTLEVVDNRGKAQVTNNWVNRERPLIARADGLSQYGAVNQVEMNSMTMSRPYSADKNVEEIWIATEGDIDILLGKELRKIPVGTAFRVPSTGITAHAQINASGKPAKFISMVR